MQASWTLLLSLYHGLLPDDRVLLWLVVAISRDVPMVFRGLGELHIGSSLLVLEGVVRHLKRVVILVATWVH